MSGVLNFVSTHAYSILAVGASAVALGATWLCTVTSRDAMLDKTPPSKMRAVRLVQFVTDLKKTHDNFKVVEVDRPVPKHGEVLVKVERSPINPSDLSSLRGSYNPEQQGSLPCGAGNEGSGTVVQTGGGFFGWRLLGKRVACVASTPGMWAEYAVVPAFQCVALPDDISFDEGSSCFVNPLTALAFIEIAQARCARSMLHTGGASQVGKMLIRLCNRYDIELICVVRREEQVAECKRIGAKYIINSSEANWLTQVKDACKTLDCRLAFDAVAGETTGKLLDAMPKLSEIQVYGSLSGQPCRDLGIAPLIFGGKRVSGFWLPRHIDGKSILKKKAMLNRMVSLLKTDLHTEVAAGYPLAMLSDAIAHYVGDMTGGKICIAPQAASVTRNTPADRKQRE